MKKGNLVWISVIAGLAIIGIISIQVYWMRNAMEIREQRFNQVVSESMVRVAIKHEKQLMVNKLQLQQFTVTLGCNDASMDSCPQDCEQLCPVNGNDVNAIVTNNGKVSAGNTSSEWMQHRNNVVKSVMQEINSVKPSQKVKPIDESLLIDSLLKQEFMSRGINMPYVFQVLEPGNRSVLNYLNESPYKVALAPENIFAPPRFLSIHFPHKQGFLLKSAWMMLSASLLFVIVLSSSFYYFVRTILVQKKLSVMKNDFINNMTHEFKTPISTISLACEVLNDKTVAKPVEKVSHYVTMIQEENKRLSKLVENILQTAVLDKGELKLSFQATNIHDIIEQAAGNILLQTEQRGGSVTTELNSGDATIQADPIHLTNVIYNLLDNALKYSAESPKIIVSTRDLGEELSITVKDNGIGISKEDQKKIFEKLFRVPTGNVHNVKGFGLGLSYVKAIVEKHGGSIHVESAPGKGSSFEIRLPKQQNDRQQN